MTDHAYCRVYHTIVDDPKFVDVYDNDAALAMWLRLLIIADQAWPTSGQLPGNTKRRAYDLLVRSGLVDSLPGWRFRVHGLDAERGRRKDAARIGGLASGRSRSVERPLNDRSPSQRTETNLAEYEPSKAEPSIARADGLPHITPAVSKAWEAATGRTVLASGAFALDYLDDACRRHPAARVIHAIAEGRATYPGIPTTQQLTASVRGLLDPMPDQKQSKADAAESRERERSRRAVQATKKRAHDVGYHADEPDPMCDACQGVAA